MERALLPKAKVAQRYGVVRGILRGCGSARQVRFVVELADNWVEDVNAMGFFLPIADNLLFRLASWLTVIP